VGLDEDVKDSAIVDEVVEDAEMVDDVDVAPEGKAVAEPTGTILHSSAPSKLSGSARTIFVTVGNSVGVHGKGSQSTHLVRCRITTGFRPWRPNKRAIWVRAYTSTMVSSG
jgi:hypothetical protein